MTIELKIVDDATKTTCDKMGESNAKVAVVRPQSIDKGSQRAMKVPNPAIIKISLQTSGCRGSENVKSENFVPKSEVRSVVDERRVKGQITELRRLRMFGRKLNLE